MSDVISKHTVLAALSSHVGHMNGIAAKLLAVAITHDFADTSAQERRLRQIITELRMEGHHICAHPETGYFIAETADELDRTCLFLYERAMASLQQISRMKQVALPDLKGQLHLPT